MSADTRAPNTGSWLDGTRLEGIFEVREHPNAYPDEMKLRRGYADQALGGWYVVIDHSRHLDESGQWKRVHHGAAWFHPDPDYQRTGCGSFDQHLTPIDDAARRIVRFVKACCKEPRG